MARPELCNGAPQFKSVPKSISSVSIDSRLFIIGIFPMNRIHLIMDESVLMLYHTAFYEMIHNRPYILESYTVDILLLSFSRPSIYPHPSIFASQSIIRLIFPLWKKDFSCYNYMIDTSYSDWFLGYR
jgi:hypothetical protein